MTHALLSEIESFLAATGMGPTYFGKLACRDPKVVLRLRKGKRVWPETDLKIRAFMLSERNKRRERASA